MKTQSATPNASRAGLIGSFCSGSDGKSSDSHVSQLRAATGSNLIRSRFPSKTRNKRTRSNELGFTLVQMLIVVAVIVVLASFAFVGITTARSRIRLSNSARQFASYAELARASAVRRHAQTSIQQINTTTYSVTMDFNGTGEVTTQNFSTENGVNINMPRTIIFDWRGRTPVETSIGFTNESGTANVGITGSGDITIDAEIFHDGSIPTTVLTGTGGVVLPDPSPDPSASPEASPSPSPSSSPGASPSPSPGSSPNPTPGSSPTPDPYPTATPTPSTSPTPATSPTPIPGPCSLSASASSLTIAENGSATVGAHLNNFSGSGTITATSSNSGQIQVSPGSAPVSGNSSASFTITVKKTSGSVTLSSSCGSQTVTVTVP